MDLNELKSTWQNAGTNDKPEADLQAMTRINHHPVLHKLRIRLIIEILLLSVLLEVYYDWFDGGLKSLKVNALLVVSIVLFILNNVVAYYFMKRPVSNVNIRQSLAKRLNALKRIAVFSMLSSLLYGVCLVTFLVSGIEFTSAKYLLLAGIGVTFLTMFYWSFRNWKGKIDAFGRLLGEFGE